MVDQLFSRRRLAACRYPRPPRPAAAPPPPRRCSPPATSPTGTSSAVWSPERSDQTAVGWVLRERSRAEPARVEAFFRRHALLMSKECARHAVAKLPPARRAVLLGLHRRATSLRRALRRAD